MGHSCHAPAEARANTGQELSVGRPGRGRRTMREDRRGGRERHAETGRQRNRERERGRRRGEREREETERGRKRERKRKTRHEDETKDSETQWTRRGRQSQHHTSNGRPQTQCSTLCRRNISEWLSNTELTNATRRITDGRSAELCLPGVTPLIG